MLTNTQLYLATGLPTLAVISSLIVSLLQLSGIRNELSEVRTDIREVRSELKLLTGKVYEMMR